MINMLLEDQLSDVLRKMRYGRKISLKQLAEQTRIAQDHLRAFEGGEKTPSPEEIALLGKSLGFDPIVLPRLHLHPENTPQPEIPDWIHPVKENYHGMDVWCYVLDLPGGKAPQGMTRSILVDTGSATHLLTDTLQRKNIHLEGILLTHGHEDHGGGLFNLPSNIPVYLNEADKSLMLTHDTNMPFTLPPEDARDLLIPEGFNEFQITPMPGHTKGSVTYRINNALFVGDGIFCGSAGKPWTPEDFGSELRSIKNLLDQNPEDLLIFSGHGPFTTVGIEKEMNPFYHCQPEI